MAVMNMNEMDSLRQIVFYQQKLIDKQNKYVQLLQAELRDTAPLAAMLDWTSHRYEAGKILRKKIIHIKEIITTLKEK